jgi:hypothetical protein
LRRTSDMGRRRRRRRRRRRISISRMAIVEIS